MRTMDLVLLAPVVLAVAVLVDKLEIPELLEQLILVAVVAVVELVLVFNLATADLDASIFLCQQ